MCIVMWVKVATVFLTGVLTFLIVMVTTAVKLSLISKVIVHETRGLPNNFMVQPVLHTEPPEKDVIVRSVYFNDRPQNGYKNASVFMLEVRKNIWKQNLIIGCGAGSYVSYSFKIWPCGASILHKWIHKNFSNLTHTELMVHCYDLPVSNGNNAFIIYKPSISSSSQIIVESERRLMIPAPAQPQVGTKIVTCSRIFNHPPWLVEWLNYQRAIGVDHVYLIIAHGAFKSMSGHLEQAIKEGFVSVELWQEWLNDSEIYHHSEALAYEDCIYRFHGTYDYAFVLDTDDFFIPMNPSEKKLHYYADKWCKYSASCAFSWIEYYPMCGLKDEPGIDGNVTAVLNSSVHLERTVGKSLHRLSVVMDVGIYQAEYAVGLRNKNKTFPLTYHHGIVKIPSDEAYVAQVRKNKLPPNTMCV